MLTVSSPTSSLENLRVPRRKHYASLMKVNQFVLYVYIFDVCSEVHTKHISIVCGQNVEYLNV